jgi:hypothetical protein
MCGIERRQQWVYFRVSSLFIRGLANVRAVEWCRPNRPRKRGSAPWWTHAHCRMSFIFPAVCTIVTRSRSAGKPAPPLEKLHRNNNGTKSACIAAAEDRKHRSINSHRPTDASSLQCLASRGRLDPTTRIAVSYRPNECSDNKSKG